MVHFLEGVLIVAWPNINAQNERFLPKLWINDQVFSSSFLHGSSIFNGLDEVIFVVKFIEHAEYFKNNNEIFSVFTWWLAFCN